VRELVSGGVNLVVHLARNPQKEAVYRFIAEIALITAVSPDGKYQMESLYSGWTGEGIDAAGLLHHAWEKNL